MPDKPWLWLSPNTYLSFIGWIAKQTGNSPEGLLYGKDPTVGSYLNEVFLHWINHAEDTPPKDLVYDSVKKALVLVWRVGDSFQEEVVKQFKEGVWSDDWHTMNFDAYLTHLIGSDPRRD